MKALLAAKDAPRGAGEVLSHWDRYVLLVAEGAIEDGSHKIRIDGTEREVLERMNRNTDAQMLETFNMSVSDGGCGFWEAILDAKTSKLDSFRCHGVA